MNVLDGLHEMPFIPSGTSERSSEAGDQSDRAMRSRSRESTAPSSIADSGYARTPAATPGPAIVEEFIEAHEFGSTHRGTRESKRVRDKTKKPSLPSVASASTIRPAQTIQEKSQKTSPSTRRREDKPPKFITSPLYAPNGPLYASPRSQKKDLREGNEKARSSVPRGAVGPAVESTTVPARRRRSDTLDQLALHNADRSSNARSETPVHTLSQPLDAVASSLGSFAWSQRPGFLSLQQFAVQDRGLVTTASAPPDYSEGNATGYFDRGVTQPIMRQNSNQSNVSWPASSWKHRRAISTNEWMSSWALKAASVRNPKGAIPTSSVEEGPLSPNSPDLQPSLHPFTPPLSASSTTTKTSSSEITPPSRSRGRSVFGGVAIPQDMERKSAKYAAIIGEKRQQKLAAREAKYSNNQSPTIQSTSLPISTT